MNIILLNDEDFIDQNLAQLRDARFLQIKQIHGSTVGHSVKIGRLNGLMGLGIIESLDAQQVTLSCKLNTEPPPKLPLTIVLALPRPKMIRRIFRNIAEYGIANLHVINSYKVEKSFWQSPAISEQHIRQYLIEGLQQAKDTQLPEVHFHKRFKPFVEDQLSDISASSIPLIAHPGTDTPCPHAIDRPVTLAIGPEGGFTPYEVDKFIEQGFQTIHLGPRILKVENALNALCAKLYS